jgi:hypothetical protein
MFSSRHEGSKYSAVAFYVRDGLLDSPHLSKLAIFKTNFTSRSNIK